MPYAHLYPRRDGPAYEAIEDLWLAHLRRRPDDLVLLANAARFFLLPDEAMAEKLLKRGQVLQPENPMWPRRLGHLYELKIRGVGMSSAQRRGAARTAFRYLRQAEPRADSSYRPYWLKEASRAAMAASFTQKARGFARELLRRSEELGWGGNAIHSGNVTLGYLALRRGLVDEAKEHLLAAVAGNPGSPHLDSFGPDMSLARALLRRGEREVVLRYLEECGRFWRMGKRRLAEWKAIIRSGKEPNFGPNLSYWLSSVTDPHPTTKAS
jgi:hypothetical protein